MDTLIAVTGASRGIGAAIAHRLVIAGYRVACVSRSGALPVIADVPDAVRARWHPFAADVGDEAALRAVFADIAALGFPLAGLVNNAGYHAEGRSAELPIAEWDAMLATNATSVVIGCQEAFPRLTEAGGGLIVNIGSFFDKLGVRSNLAYCASKAAVGAITRVLAVEWARHGIAVINVAPGFILTDLNRAEYEGDGPLRPYLEQRIPGRQPGSAEDVATLVAGLFAMGRPFLTGETIYVDGGQGLVV